MIEYDASDYISSPRISLSGPRRRVAQRSLLNEPELRHDGRRPGTRCRLTQLRSLKKPGIAPVRWVRKLTFRIKFSATSGSKASRAGIRSSLDAGISRADASLQDPAAAKNRRSSHRLWPVPSTSLPCPTSHQIDVDAGPRIHRSRTMLNRNRCAVLPRRTAQGHVLDHGSALESDAGRDIYS